MKTMKKEEINKKGKSAVQGGKPISKRAMADLTQKINVDREAIKEACEAVGNDEEKIREYLINNRGL